MHLNRNPFARALFVATSMLTLAASCAPATPSAPAELPLTMRDGAGWVEEAYGVPADLVLAVSYIETRFQIPETHSHEPGLNEDEGDAHVPQLVGVGAIRPWMASDPVAIAESALQISRDQIHANPVAGVLATGAVLAEIARERGVDADDPAAWSEVLADYADLHDPIARAEYAEQILDVLRSGVRADAADGTTIEIAPRAIGALEFGTSAAALSRDYPSARVVDASPSNFTRGRAGNSVEYVIIHTMQGSYSGSISWFQNPSARVSAHYMVRSSDGQITQMVDESDNAWHAGNSTYNRRSIGIEHEGFIEDPGRWYTDTMYRASAALVRNICQRYGIPMDRQHIIGHREVPGATHTDPGSGWDWNKFMGYVRQNGGGGGGTTVPTNADPIEVQWDRQADGSYAFRAVAPARVTRVEYKVDGFTIGTSTRTASNDFAIGYRFNGQTNGRKLEVIGYDASNASVGLGVGSIDVTAAENAIYIRQVGRALYEIGLERPAANVAAIEVSADQWRLTDAVSGAARSSRRAVRSAFTTLGPRQFSVRLYDAAGAALGTQSRSFTLR